jgi:hypothetical protein
MMFSDSNLSPQLISIEQVREAGQDVDLFRKEVNAVSNRINSLIEEASPSKKPKRQGTEAFLEEVLENKVPDNLDAASLRDVNVARSRVTSLLAQLNFDERDSELNSVSSWFRERLPRAEQEMEDLVTLDRDCYRRESEHTFAAMSMDATLRRNRKTGHQALLRFCRDLEEATALHVIPEETQRYDPKLIGMSVADLEVLIEELEEQVKETEAAAWIDFQECQAHMPDWGKVSDEDALDDVARRPGADILSEQEKLLFSLRESLKEMDSQKEEINDLIEYVSGKSRPVGKFGEPLPLSETSKSLLSTMKQEVASRWAPDLLSKRKADHGEDVELPSSGYLTRLQAEISDLERRTQRADVLKTKFFAEGAEEVEREKRMSDINSGSTSQLRLLENFLAILDPEQDWESANFADEDPDSPMALEGDRLAQKEAELREQTQKLLDELAELQEGYVRAQAQLRTTQSQVHEKEESCNRAQDSLHVLEEQLAQVTNALSCTRLYRHLPEAAINSAKSSLRGQLALPPEGRPGVRRPTLQTSTSPQASTTKAPDAATEIVREALGEVYPQQGSTWNRFFREGDDGFFTKESLTVQNEVLAGLEREELQLKKECQKLDEALASRLNFFLHLGVKGGVSQAQEAQVRACSQNAQSAVKELNKVLKSLSTLSSTVSSSNSIAQDMPKTTSRTAPRIELLPAEKDELQFRQQAVENAKSILQVLQGQGGQQHYGTGTYDIREILGLEEENRKLVQKIKALQPDLDEGRAQFRRTQVWSWWNSTLGIIFRSS